MAKLKRNITFTLLTFYGIGTILGAGIYVLIGKVAAFANVYTPFAFLLAACVAGATGLTIAELSSRFPQSGGCANYTLKAFNNHFMAATVGWLIVLTGVVSAATIARGAVGYINTFVDIPAPALIILIITSLSALAIWGIKESVLAAAMITILEVTGLLIVIISARPDFTTLTEYAYTILPPVKAQFWPGIFAGVFIAFYAFVGFEDMVTLAEEVIEPEKNLPRAIISAIAVSTILYLLVSLVAISSLPVEQLAASKAPMSELFELHGGSAKLMSLISLIAVINGALVQIIMASRVIYGMAEQGSTMNWLGKVSARTHTPVIATILVAIVILLFALALPITRLAQIASFLILVIFSLINVALILVKRRPDTKTYHVNFPIIIPVLGCIMCLTLVVMQLL